MDEPLEFPAVPCGATSLAFGLIVVNEKPHQLGGGFKVGAAQTTPREGRVIRLQFPSTRDLTIKLFAGVMKSPLPEYR